MRVTCLEVQKSCFETRSLMRMAEPVYALPGMLPGAMEHPLLLFGDWFEGDFRRGLAWLGRLAYRLPRSCIVCPPFQPGSVQAELGLPVGLGVRNTDVNRLAIGEELALLMEGQREVKVQADFAFVGGAGKPLVTTADESLAVVTVVQPRSTDTPLFLCGARLLSASALSDTADRQRLFEALIDRARQTSPVQISAVAAGDSDTLEVSPDIVKSIAVLLAGTGNRSQKELLALASSALGQDLAPDEVDKSLRVLADLGLAHLEGEVWSADSDRLRSYLDALGLGAYVRILRDDFVRRGKR